MKNFMKIHVKTSVSKFLFSNKKKNGFKSSLIITNGIKQPVMTILIDSKRRLVYRPEQGLMNMDFSHDKPQFKKWSGDDDVLPGTIYHVYNCGSYIGSFSTDDGCGDTYAVNLCGITHPEVDRIAS